MLAFVYVMSLVGCNTKDTAIGTSAFETENITGVTFYGSAPTNTETEVLREHLAEITEWLGAFVVAKKADDVLPPGSHSLFIKIEYSDGSTNENSMSTTIIDGTTYLINYDKEPECYFELFAE